MKEVAKHDADHDREGEREKYGAGVRYDFSLFKSGDRHGLCEDADCPRQVEDCDHDNPVKSILEGRAQCR